MKAIFYIYSIVVVLIGLGSYVLGIDDIVYVKGIIIAYGVQLLLFGIELHANNPQKLQLLRPFFILLIGMTIVNFQSIIDTIFGGFSSELVQWKLLRYLPKCTYLAVVSQTALSIGYFANNKQYDNATSRSQSTIKTAILTTLLICSFVLFIATIDIHAFMSGDAMANDGSYNRKVGTLSLYSELIFGVMLVIYVSVKSQQAIGIKSFREYVLSFSLIFWVIFAIYIILRLFSGDRGPVIYNILLVSFGYVYASKHRFKAATIVITFIVGAFLVTLVGIARLGGTKLSFGNKMEQAYVQFDKNETDSYITITRELAGSVKTTAIAIRGVEDKHSMQQHYGMGHILSIIGTIPFSTRIINFFLPDVNLLKFSSSEVITRDALGNKYTYGLGTSSIADVYLDFGIWLLPILFFFFGWLYKRIDVTILRLEHTSSYFLTFALYMSSYAIYIGRSSFAFVISNALMTLLIQYIITQLTKGIRVS